MNYVQDVIYKFAGNKENDKNYALSCDYFFFDFDFLFDSYTNEHTPIGDFGQQPRSGKLAGLRTRIVLSVFTIQFLVYHPLRLFIHPIVFQTFLHILFSTALVLAGSFVFHVHHAHQPYLHVRQSPVHL